MSNPTPDLRGLDPGRGVVVYVEDQIDEFLRCCVKGVPYTQPDDLPERPRFIRKKEAIRRVGLSYVTMWSMERQGRFPRRFHIAPGGVDAAA